MPRTRDSDALREYKEELNRWMDEFDRNVSRQRIFGASAETWAVAQLFFAASIACAVGVLSLLFVNSPAVWHYCSLLWGLCLCSFIAAFGKARTFSAQVANLAAWVLFCFSLSEVFEAAWIIGSGTLFLAGVLLSGLSALERYCAVHVRFTPDMDEQLAEGQIKYETVAAEHQRVNLMLAVNDRRVGW